MEKSQAIANFNLFLDYIYQKMTYWLFQGNPKYYRIIDGIRDFEQMPRLTTRYFYPSTFI